MPHPVIHAEIRSDDPDATRQFFADLFGWKRRARKVPSPATRSSTRASRTAPTSRSARSRAPRTKCCSSSASRTSTPTLRKAEELGGTIVQPAQHVPGTSFGVFADAQGHKVGVADASLTGEALDVIARGVAMTSRPGDEQWQTRSLCGDWTVQTLGHMTAAVDEPAEVDGPLRGPASVRRVIEKDIARPGGRADLARFRSIELERPPAGSGRQLARRDVVHAEDIRRPLGIAHDYPSTPRSDWPTSTRAPTC